MAFVPQGQADRSQARRAVRPYRGAVPEGRMCLASVFPAGRALEFGHLEAGFHFVPEGRTDRSLARSAWESVLERTVP